MRPALLPAPLFAALALVPALVQGLAPPAAAAQASNGIQGIIRSSQGLRPVPYANIQVVGQPVGDWTDDHGAYTLEGLTEGRWRVRIAHPGHDSLQLDVHVPPDRRLTLDLVLRTRPGPPAEPLADFEPFAFDFTLPTLLNREEVRSLIEARYPGRVPVDELTREAVLRLWLDERGQVVRAEIASSSGLPALDSIAAEVADRMRFRPAKNRAEPVRVIALIPVVFTPPARARPDA